MLILATQLNTIVLAYLLWKQTRFSKEVFGVQDPAPTTEVRGDS
jgi:ABC-type glucose/galactose transport system permease subunit